jgi:hypothetical protein
MPLPALAALLLALAPIAGAQPRIEGLDFDESFGGNSSERYIESLRWEFGFRFAKASGVGKLRRQSVQANNSAFLVSDPGNIGEDEFAENGLPSPNFAGQTTLVADRQSMTMLGFHTYYRAMPWVAVGFEFSYFLREDLPVVAAGPFSAPIYKTRWWTTGMQPVAAVRLGDWIRGYRPWVMFGMGPYWVYQHVTAELLDPDDADHPPVQAANTVDVYKSLLYGLGLDVRWFDEGSVGVAYQWMNVPDLGQMFGELQLRLAYHF